jgi:hypothetical protein
MCIVETETDFKPNRTAKPVKSSTCPFSIHGKWETTMIGTSEWLTIALRLFDCSSNPEGSPQHEWSVETHDALAQLRYQSDEFSSGGHALD